MGNIKSQIKPLWTEDRSRKRDEERKRQTMSISTYDGEAPVTTEMVARDRHPITAGRGRKRGIGVEGWKGGGNQADMMGGK